MQYEIILKAAQRDYYIRDRRGAAPHYRAFDFVSADESHTVSPNRSHALEVAEAYREYAAKFPSFALPGRVVARAVEGT